MRTLPHFCQVRLRSDPGETETYYTDKKLQFPVCVEKPNPLFARMLQRATGGVEGEIRFCVQYFFQAWGARGPAKYRDTPLNTATEEIAHIEFFFRSPWQ